MKEAAQVGFAELFGIGGAGKTTLLRRMSAHAGPGPTRIGRPPHPHGVDVAARSMLLAASVSVRKPLAVARMLGSPGGRWLIAKLGYRLATFAGRDPDVPMILADAGFLEPFVTHAMLHGSEVDPPTGTFLQYLPTPAVAVSVQCDVDVALARFLARESELNRSVNRDNATLSRWFRHAELRTRTLENWCQKAGVRLLEIDTTDAPDDDEVGRLLRQVTTHLEGAHA